MLCSEFRPELTIPVEVKAGFKHPSLWRSWRNAPMGKCRLESEMQVRQTAEAPKQGPASRWDARGQEGLESLRPHCEWELKSLACTSFHLHPGRATKGPRETSCRVLSPVMQPPWPEGSCCCRASWRDCSRPYHSRTPRGFVSANSLWGAPCPHTTTL